MLLGLLLQTGLKEAVDRPRTSVLFLEQLVEFDSASFPSGHAMSSVIAGSLVFYVAFALRPGPATGPLALWGVAACFLNPWVSVASGVHWPSDALGGTVWGLVVAIPGVLLLERARRAA